MPLVNFRNFFLLLSLRFSPEFRSSNNFAVTEYTRKQIFLERYPKKMFFKKFTVVLLDGFLNGFSKFWFFLVENLHFNLGFLSNFWKLLHAHAEHMRKRFYRTLSLRGNDFIAHWAYEEQIFAHVRPAVKVFTYKSMLSIRGTHFIAGWVYAERISSLAELTQKCLKVEYLDRIEYDFQKSRATGPGYHKVSVSAKK